jgi:hypothetical protein
MHVLPRFQEENSFLKVSPGIARLSFWKQQRVDEEEYGVLME